MEIGVHNNLLQLYFIEFCYRVYCLVCLIYHVTVFTVCYGIQSMTEEKPSKKRKRSPKMTTQTVCNRTAINANWQALLSSNLLSGDTKKPQPTDKYTGTFRRARKKNANKPAHTPQVDDSDLASKQNEEKEDKLLENTEKDSASKEKKLTKVLAMDCEMVGIGADGSDHMIARVSIVNRFGDCVYDKFVKAREEVVDYRTKISGIRKEDMMNGEEFAVVQKEVAELIRSRVLVGHSLKHDLDVLFLSHPKRFIRDTSKYKPFRKITRGNTPSLKRLAAELLGADIQGGEHSSVEDARAAMQLYSRVAKEWERSLAGRRNKAAV